MPVWKLFGGDASDVLPLAEEVLEDLVGLELYCVWLVDLPPEEFVALESGYEAGFGEAVILHCIRDLR